MPGGWLKVLWDKFDCSITAFSLQANGNSNLYPPFKKMIMQNQTPTPQVFTNSNSSVSTITVADAKLRIKTWLDIVGTLPGFQGKDEKLTPRAILIPIADILSILDEYKHQRRHQGHPHPNKEPMGVRVYFSLLPDLLPIGPATSYEVRGTVVAVTHEYKDFPYKSMHHSEEDDGSNDYVFDFTSPCPSTCDASSQLFVPASG